MSRAKWRNAECSGILLCVGRGIQSPPFSYGCTNSGPTLLLTEECKTDTFYSSSLRLEYSRVQRGGVLRSVLFRTPPRCSTLMGEVTNPRHFSYNMLISMCCSFVLYFVVHFCPSQYGLARCWAGFARIPPFFIDLITRICFTFFGTLFSSRPE